MDYADPFSVRHPTTSSGGEDEKNDTGALVEESSGAGDRSSSGRCDGDVASVENDGDNDDDDRDMTGERQESRGGDNGVLAGTWTTEGTAADASKSAFDGANEPRRRIWRERTTAASTRPFANTQQRT